MNTNDDNREKDAAKGEPVPLQPIIDMGSTVVKSSRGTVHCLTIVVQVEGHTLLPDNTKTTKYEHVLPLLAALEQSEQVEGLLLLLNTVGGDIEAGLAIAELAAGMTKPVVTLVLGGGHSIGVPLAVCGKETFIAPTASMTVHPVRMSGTVIAAPETYRYFERIRERIVQFVAANSRVTAERPTTWARCSTASRRWPRASSTGWARCPMRWRHSTGRSRGGADEQQRRVKRLSAFFVPLCGFFLKIPCFHSILS